MAAVPKPTRKRVATQEANWRRNWRQLTPLPLMFSQRPTPMTAPVMHWLEEVGRPYLRTRTQPVNTSVNSQCQLLGRNGFDNPRHGWTLVAERQPYTQRTAPTASTIHHTGVTPFSHHMYLQWSLSQTLCHAARQALRVVFQHFLGTGRLCQDRHSK